jgi:hypothetical protein
MEDVVRLSSQAAWHDYLDQGNVFCREKTGLSDDSRSGWLLSTTFAECLLASLDRDK